MKRFLMVVVVFSVVAAFGAPTSWAQAEGKTMIVIKENEEREGVEGAEEQVAVEAMKHALMGKVATATAAVESKKVKVTYLGVVTSPTTEVLTSQLKLPKDTALVVEQVAPKSPAETAGVKPNDVLVKLDDQILINIEQFRVLVRMRKPGDVVRLTYVREGAQAVAVATLSEEWETASVDILREPWGPGMAREELARDHEMTGLKKLFGGVATAQINDGVRTVTVEQKDGARSARVVENATGKVIFDGPIDTPEQRKALPPEVAKLLEGVRIYEAPESPLPPAPEPAPFPAPAPEEK